MRQHAAQVNALPSQLHSPLLPCSGALYAVQRLLRQRACCDLHSACILSTGISLQSSC